MVDLFVGFPRDKRVIDVYARCMMCRADFSIARRGIQNLWGHRKGARHTRIEQKFKIMTQHPLLDKSCRPVTVEEEQRIRLECMSEPPVYLELLLSLTSERRFALEQESEAAINRPTLKEPPISGCVFFINCLSSVTNFRNVKRLMDSWGMSLRGEMSVVEQRLFNVKCQVRPCFVFLIPIFVLKHFKCRHRLGKLHDVLGCIV